MIAAPWSTQCWSKAKSWEVPLKGSAVLLHAGVGEVSTGPGAIYLFRRNLLRVCADRDELKREVRITVQHEVGHLLGLDEDDLERWGLA